jgi:hypothetical protein
MSCAIPESLAKALYMTMSLQLRQLILYVNRLFKCFYCGKNIFDDLLINPQTGKRVPLNPEDHTRNKCGPVSSSSPLPTFFGK